ncbi:MAG TPA: hypothetical protein VGE99_01655 [Candidatus Dormibacteraeota bacterium]
MEPPSQASIRRAFLWAYVSFIPLVGSLAWALFATRQWPGSRGRLLTASGFMLLLAASSASFYPILRTLAPQKRLLGLSVAKYIFVSIAIALGLAAAAAVLAIATPQT